MNGTTHFISQNAQQSTKRAVKRPRFSQILKEYLIRGLVQGLKPVRLYNVFRIPLQSNQHPIHRILTHYFKPIRCIAQKPQAFCWIPEKWVKETRLDIQTF